MSGLSEFFREKKEIITSKNIKKILQEVYTKVEQLDPRLFYDFLGEILLQNPDLLERKIINQYLMVVKKGKIPPGRLIELETYFLKKYSLFNGEELLQAFNGVLLYKKMYLISRMYKYSGRVYITNYRIIVMGKAVEVQQIT